MRAYGEIGGVKYRNLGPDIYSQSTGFKLIYEGHSTKVSADNMKELSQAIAEFRSEIDNEY